MATSVLADKPSRSASARSGRGTTLRGPLLSTGFVLVAGIIMMAFFAQQYVGSVFVLSLTYAIVTAGMAIQIGFSQQIAFSQSVFMGLGAYGVAALNVDAGIGVPLAAVIVTLGSGIAATLIGRVVTKAPGLALAVATIMFPLIATGYLSSAGYLGGAVGMPLTGSLWTSSSVTATVVGNGLVVVVIISIVVFIGSRILSSDIGLEFFALGVSEGTAAAMGVSTPRRKLELFVVGSMLASLGGAMYAGTEQFVPATLVGVTTELSLLMMLFVGGRRSVIGAVIGAFAIQYVQGASNFVSIHILIIEGVLITAVLLIEPEGLAGIGLTLVAWARARRAGGRGVSSLVLPGVPGALDAEVEQALEAGESHEERGVAASNSPFRLSWAERVAERGGSGDGTLACSGVNKEYGGLKVLDDVSFSLPSRGIFGLCGPNGAGKTTLLNVIGGSVSPSAGGVSLGEREITRLPASERFHLGVSRTFQAVHLIRGRTVIDNVAVACLDSNRTTIARGIVRNRLADARDRAMEALEYLGLGDLAGLEATSLTLERQRMVELARAIASKPRVLLLDEPASGLSEAQREELKDVLRTVAELTCVVLVEHDLGLVAAIAERIFVLATGRLVFEGTAEEFRGSPLVGTLLMGV